MKFGPPTYILIHSSSQICMNETYVKRKGYFVNNWKDSCFTMNLQYVGLILFHAEIVIVLDFVYVRSRNDQTDHLLWMPMCHWYTNILFQNSASTNPSYVLPFEAKIAPPCTMNQQIVFRNKTNLLSSLLFMSLDENIDWWRIRKTPDSLLSMC